ncbi:hypothetical protein Plhal703r1_c02g0009281 [Plasmopara halstedii]
MVASLILVSQSFQMNSCCTHATWPLASLSVFNGVKQSLCVDFIFGLSKDASGCTVVVVLVDQTHFADIRDTATNLYTTKAEHFLDKILAKKTISFWSLFHDRRNTTI